MPLAAIYLRLSRNEEELDIDEILTKHRNALIKLAKIHKLTYEIYPEISSGVNNDRPKLNKLLSKLDQYDYLLVMDIDRISRDNAYAEQIKTMLIAHDIKILTPQGAIDLTQESNEMLFSFQAMMANFEYKQIKKRLSRGRLAAAEQGRWVNSNKAPLGYKKDENKKLVIVEEEAKIIRHIFENTKNYSANEIAKQLDQLGWKSRSGKKLTTSQISSIRRNVVYYGVVAACRRVNGRVVDEVFVEGAHDPIVSKQQWLEVQKILDENDTGNFFNKAKVSRKLQNLLFCNCCSRKRYIQMDGNGTDFVKSCSYKISNNACKDRGYKYLPVEDFVIQKVKEKRQDFLQALENLKALDTTNEEKKIIDQRNSLEKQMEKLNKRQKNLQIMRMDGEISKTDFFTLSQENEEKIKQVNNQIELINIQLENLNNTEEEQERLEKYIKTLDNIESLEPEDCNMFLKSFIKKIWFSTNATTDHNTKREPAEVTIELEWL